MATEQRYLPETPEELTPGWLSEALQTRVTDIRQEVLGDGVGFMGDVLRLHLQGDSAALPASVVVKLPKKANRVMGEMLGVYEREIMFFREFGSQVPLRIPKVYFSDFDRDKGSENQAEILRKIDGLPLFLNGVINRLGRLVAGSKKRRYMLIIEFLQDMQPGDQLQGLDAAGCSQVLSEVAAMHSAYWDSPSIDNHFWLLDMDVDARLRHGIFTQHVDSFAATVPGDVADKLAWLKQHGLQLTRQFFAGAPKTLLHYDLRLDNVVFDGPHCAFIDWQLVRAGPAAYDVAYFMASALPEHASREDVEQILHVYHQALGRADYSFDMLWLDYQRALLLVLSTLSSVEQVDIGEGRGKDMMEAWMRRLAARVADVDLQAVASA
ncbi:MAG: phosphotransferase [Pseudomonadota bacterium]